MDNNPQQSFDLEKELLKQKELLVNNYDMLKSIRRTARISAMINMVRLLIIIIPLILAIVYLPSIIREYSSVLDAYTSFDSGYPLPKGLDLEAIQSLIER